MNERGPEGRGSITLRELEVLQTVIQTGKAMTAARQLGISQSAVSRRLAQLAGRLSYPLFTRAGGGLVPTQEALALNDRIGPILGALDAITAPVVPGDPVLAGPLRIAAPPTIAHRFLPGLVGTFAKRHPDLSVTFDVLASDSLITSIAEYRFDLGLTDSLPQHAGVRCVPFLRTEAICLLPAGHPLCERDVIHAEDLEGAPVVALTRRHSMRVATDRVFERAGVTRRIVIETATLVSTVEFVREGLGIAVINPFPMIHQLGQGVAARPFEPAVACTANFILPSTQAQSAAARAFMDHVHAGLDRAPYPDTLRLPQDEDPR